MVGNGVVDWVDSNNDDRSEHFAAFHFVERVFDFVDSYFLRDEPIKLKPSL
jgi:hypothetical protein